MPLPRIQFGPISSKINATRGAQGLREAAEALTRSMHWATTPEGDGFWRSIYERLLLQAEALEINGAMGCVPQPAPQELEEKAIAEIIMRDYKNNEPMAHRPAPRPSGDQSAANEE